MSAPYTQKAKGIRYIPYSNLYHVISSPRVDALILPYFLVGSVNFPTFARPCPMRPRHGFVESRIVYNVSELLLLYKEILQEDPQGEIVLMDFIEAKYSTVATNTGVSWGFGQDGATSGQSTTIPTSTEVDIWNRETLGGKAENEASIVASCCYVELVTDFSERTTIVQFRDGPAIECNKDFIPKVVKVESVIVHAGESLLVWEEIIKDAKGRKGVCVWLPGMALSSHHAVHAIQNDIPVWTHDTSPAGMILYPSTNRPNPYTEADFVTLADWIRHFGSTEEDFGQHRIERSAYCAVATIHAGSLWSNDPCLLKLRAFGLTLLARLMTAACAGEDRYWKSKGPGRDNNNLQHLDVKKYTDDYGGLVREYIYNKVISCPLGEILDIAILAQKDFRTRGWGRRRSFGGMRWAITAASAKKLAKSLIEFVEAPNKASWDTLVMAGNQALQVSHNTGKVLTKWISNSVLDTIAVCPGIGFMNYRTAELVLENPIPPPATKANFESKVIDDEPTQKEEEDEERSRRDEECLYEERQCRPRSPRHRRRERRAKRP